MPHTHAPKDPLSRLAKLYGIGASYHDFRGTLHEVSRASRVAILAALGVDASSDEAIESAIHAFETSRWMRTLPPAVTATFGAAPAVPVAIPVDLHATQIDWTLTLEDGQQREGTARIRDLAVEARGKVDASSFIRCVLELPSDLPLGYHRVAIALDTGLSAQARLIIAPAHCHKAAAIAAGQRVWGIAVQLYSLRSADNWGMGDFRDLRELITLVAPLGCGLIGLNPLHALLPADPSHISPYSPSSRQFLNVLYIAIPDVPEFADCGPAQALIADPDFQASLGRLREPVNVDYPGVARAKFAALRLLYAHFRTVHLQPGTERAAAFQRYVAERGEPLQLHAIYDALDAHFRLQGPQYWGWPSWPEEYRDPSSSVVNRFARDRSEEVEYFLWLQWLAEEQLQSAQELARAAGMSIGLYGDVAVGANPAGSETWSNRHLYLQGASVGAPPDELALKGQDWGIPPQNPFELRLQEYQPFIVMVRNNMRCVGALRFDHVMTLFRLWWVPGGMISAEGSYVHYPLHDLIAILALESVRQHCSVIGEDLGTVPEEVRRAMEHYELNHYKVLLFEKHSDGTFKKPAEYVRNSLATVTTHDLPTLRSWWESLDITLREQLNLYPSAKVCEQVRAGRARELPAMMQALVAQGLWHWQPAEPLPQYSAALARAIQAYLGLSAANFAMIQIEDLIGVTAPTNVPGTYLEHANWQRKVTMDTRDILERHEVRDMLEAMNRARRGENPNA
ncbi:MAG TPA: 4-alpha-glucanotransferase [Povalibacter sp.]|nr:4-alpha-glucanotransferase [Povalibacter sp.]